MFLQQPGTLRCKGFLLRAQGAVFPGKTLDDGKQAVDLFLEVSKLLLDQMCLLDVCCHVANIVRLPGTVNAVAILR